MMNLDKEIKFVENDQSDLYGVKILKGPYKDVIYTYGKVNLSEDEANDRLVLKFDFKIEFTPSNLKKNKLEKNKNFKNYLGDILSILMEEKYLKDEKNENFDKPSIELFNEWLNEWLSKITGIDKYNVHLGGAFCQNYFFNKNIDTEDVDVLLELKPKANIDYHELKHILRKAEEIAFQKRFLIDIYLVEDALKFTDKIIMTGKDITRKSDTEYWNEDIDVTELIPGLYEIIEDSTDAHNKYLSKNYEVISKKLTLPNN